MDNRAIGVFDSGLGGLTSLKMLKELLPDEDLIYLGDTGRVPYGGRSRETLMQYARQDMNFLKKFGPKVIVVACNTLCATALDIIKNEYEIPLIGVIEPSAEKAAALSKNGKIGVIGTKATVKSGIYEKKIAELSGGTEIITKACPLLVPLVENGRIKSGDVVIETVLHEYLEDIKASGADTLIMGCTHYPLLEGLIAAEMGEGVTLINSGAEAAKHVAKWLYERDMLNDRGGRCEFYVTDDAADFESTASLFLGSDIHGVVRRVTL